MRNQLVGQRNQDGASRAVRASHRFGITASFCTVAALGVAIIASPAFAQSERATLDEVVVTAQKRSESIQDVPFAISALSQKTLDDNGMHDLEDLTYLVPGLGISGQPGGRSQINIRGINSGEMRRDNVRSSETVGLYLDEIPLGAVLYNVDLEPVDLERIEVLRGPQGTLYGSGSLAGTIRYISNRPVINEFEGMVDVGYGSINHGDNNTSARGMLNIPLIDDKLAARIVGYSHHRGGWIDNVASGQGVGEDVNYSDTEGLRLAMLWTPNDTWSVQGTFVHQKIKRGSGPEDDAATPATQWLVDSGAIPSSGNPSLGTTSYDPTASRYEMFSLVNETSGDDIDILNLVIKGDLGFAELTSSTSYYERRIEAFLDISMARSSSQFGPGYYRGTGSTSIGGPPDQPIVVPGVVADRNYAGVGLNEYRDINTVTQEIRLASQGDGPFNWIGGVYYSNMESEFDQPAQVIDPIVVPTLLTFHQRPVGDLFFTAADQEVEQIAIFGEVSYNISDLGFILGARYFEVEQYYQATNGGIFRRNDSPIDGPPVTDPAVKPRETGTNPKAMITYTPSDDVLISLQAAQGFRLGGPQNLIDPSVEVDDQGNVVRDCIGDIAAISGFDVDVNGFDSETLWNYELALKSNWRDNRLRVNASVFHIDYSDLQVNTRLDCGATVTTNAGGGTSDGVEIEINGVLTDSIQFGLNGSFIEAELTDDLLDGAAEAGDPLLFAPKVKINASLNYSKPILNNLNLYAIAFVQYTGDMEAVYKNETQRVPLPSEGSRILDSYSTINLRIGISSDEEGWDVQVFADNLTDEYAFTQLDSSAPGNAVSYLSYSTIQPRTVGVKAIYRF